MLSIQRLFILFRISSSSYLCNSCTKTLNIGTISQIGVCPTGYSLVDSTCITPADFYSIFHVNFSASVPFTNSSISSLKVATGTFSSPGNPFPTKDRGFYFPKNSYLVYSETFIPSPFQNYDFFIRILEAGTIIIIEGTSTFLEFSGKDSITLDYRYCGTDYLCTLAENILVYTNQNSGNDLWIYYYLKINEITNSINFYLEKDQSQVASVDVEGENAIGVLDTGETFTAKIGNSNGGFRGFLYIFSLTNTHNPYYLETYFVNLCNPYYYLENNQCYPTNCQNLSPFWAVRSTCSVCFNNQCPSCTDYTHDIFECDTGTVVCPDGCTQCTSSTCQICDTNYFLINNGSSTYCNNSILFSLSSNRLGLHVISGNNKNTDSENNPESDDPIPSPGRGYYFDGDAFLTTQTSFIIPVDFTISMWVFPISGTIFSKGLILETSFNLDTSITLTNLEDSTTSTEIFYTNYESFIWQYFSIEAYYKIEENIYYGSGESQTATLGKKALMDTLSNQFYLGKGSTFFTGFIAYFFIGSRNLDSNFQFGYGNDIKFPYGMNLNPCFEASMSCTVTCTNCDLCQDFSTGECFDCPRGSYYDEVTCAGLETSAGYNTFLDSLYKNRGSCLLSFKGLACSQCDSPYVLYENLCISSCPSGYSLVQNKCIKQTSDIFSFFGDNYLKVSILGDVSFGSSSQEYPNIDLNDPTPAYNRGYYFKSSSYLTISQVTLGPRFKLSIWMFILTNGIVFRKYNSATTINLFLNAGTDLASTVLTVFKTDTVNNYNYANVWQYYSISVSFDPAQLLTTLISDYNSNNKMFTYIEFDFFEDQTGFNLIFGSDQSDGFIGFIYSIQIFNQDDIADTHYFEPSSLTCGESPFQNACLSECLISEYYDVSNEICDTCSQSCANGCVRVADCVLCTKKLCDECSSFESSCITCKAGAIKDSQGNCECGSGYMEDTSTNTCISCAINCDKCTGVQDTQCIKCLSGYKFYTNYGKCIPADTCPGINPSTSDSCTFSDILLISCEFKKFQDTFYDSSNQISFKTGSSSDSYPSYSTSDPWVIPGRGMYFEGSQFLEMDKENKFKFGPEFTISLWAKVYDSGNLFIRKDQSSVIELQVTFSPGASSILVRDYQSLQATSTSPASFSAGVWHLFQYFFGSSASAMNTFSQSKSVYCFLFLDWFKDTVSPCSTYIGKFKGFIWSVDIYNFLHEVLENASGGPQSISLPLSECEVVQYGDLCTQCPATCINGCRRSETCSMCQDKLCKKCSDEETCLECFSFAQFKSGGCECVLDFNSTSMACNPVLNCFGFCSRCYSEAWNACFQCKSGYFLFEGVCISCPTGSLANGACLFRDALVFKSKFESLKGVFYDEVSNVPVITGNSNKFYPDFDSEDPIPAYLRGFYFDGVSSVVRLPVFGDYKAPALILSINWTLEIWLNPSSSSGCLFSLRETNSILSLCQNSINISVDLLQLNSSLKTENFELSSPIQSWNLISLKFSYSSSAFLSLSLNSIRMSQKTLTGSFLPNFYPGQYFEIGKSSANSFKGFIYQVSAYSGDASSPRLLISSDCSNPLNGYCIPDCNIDQFWLGPGFNNCQDCRAGCNKGCRRNDSCSLCSDPLCQNCNTFETGTCSKCSSGSSDLKNCQCDEGKVIDFNNYTCVECQSDQFYDLFSCVDCPELCETCENSSFCLTCSENSHLENRLCTCDLGFVFESSCEARWFQATASKSGNVIEISFNEDLLAELTSSDLRVADTRKYLKSFSVEKKDESTYLLSLAFEDILKAETKVSVDLNSSIFSIKRSKLNETSFNFTFSANQYSVYMEQAQKYGTVVSATLTASTISVSLVNPNPATLWSFVNNIQMLCFIGLSTIDIPPQFFGYLKGLKKYNMFPNFFEYLVTDSGGNKPYQRAFDFGYKNHLVLKNIGNFVSAFIFLLFMWLLTFACFKLNHRKPFSIKFIKEKVESSLLKYKYNALIRFWITAFMDFCAASVFGIILTDQVSVVGVFNFIISLAALVRVK